jgi:hypothetical protein
MLQNYKRVSFLYLLQGSRPQAKWDSRKVVHGIILLLCLREHRQSLDMTIYSSSELYR